MNDTLIEILKYLATPKTIKQLARNFNLPQLEILKLIEALEQVERNLVKYNHHDGNYCLTRKLDWFNQEQLIGVVQANNTNGLDYNLEVLMQVSSTNSYVLSNINNYLNNSLVTTEFQFNGRGRNNKHWLNRVATDIALSMVYWFDLSFSYQLLPLVAVIAVNRLFKSYNINTRIKWPNDVLLLSKEKIAGILVESGVFNRRRYVVIGIGVDNIIGVNRSELLISLIRHMDDIVKDYQSCGFTMLKQEWLANCIHYNQMVNILRNQELIDSGINIGIDDSGALLISNASGQVNSYNSIDVSLR